MRGAFLALVGAVAIALSAAGLVEHDLRAGPLDLSLGPAVLDVEVTGTFASTPGAQPVFGLCTEPPCAPSTRVDLLLEGLPSGSYTATVGGQDAGALSEQDGTHRLRWQAQAYIDDPQLELVHADQVILRVALQSRTDTVAQAAWTVPPGTLRANEIGGVTVSTVAKATIPALPPEGWTFHATLFGDQGVHDLGPLEREAEASVLDARVERLGLEHQHRLVVDLRPEGAPTGFPVLESWFWQTQ